MLRSALLWASTNPAIANTLPRYRFARRAVQRFMPGEHIDDALRACELLRIGSIPTVITRLGENVTTGAEAEDVTTHYLDVLRTIAGTGLNTHISIKPTQLGLDFDPELCRSNLSRLVQHAQESNNIVWIDMESSAYVDRTIDLFMQVRQENANIGICLQAYLHRTPADLERLLSVTTAIRLVKGAYREPPSIAIQNKAAVDAAYVQLASRLLEEVASGREVGSPPAIATHDLNIIRRVGAITEGLGMPRDACDLQMLYGIQRDAQSRLAGEGYRVRVLISYGSAWFPWYMRRLAERPANVWFLVRNIVG